MSPGPVRWLEAIGSTQDAAHQMAAAGAPHGAVVAARVQTAGRGTRRRQWISSEGGLWLSVVCRPRESLCLEAVSLRTGLALAALLDRRVTTGTRVRIKWPNDLYLDDRKVGGILAEARWQGDTLAWLVVGVGLNLHNPLPDRGAPNAARLADFGVRASPEELAPAVAIAVAEAVRTGAPLTPEEVRAFEARDWLRGRRLALPEPGTVLGISQTGHLRIRSDDGRVLEILGEATLADSPA